MSNSVNFRGFCTNTRYSADGSWAGEYKVPYSPPLKGEEFIKPVGEEYLVLNREGNIMAMGKNIKWIKGKGKSSSL